MPSKIKGVFWIIVLLAIVAVLAFRNQILDYFSPQVQRIENIALNAAIDEVKKQFSAPPPLKLEPKAAAAIEKPAAPAPRLTVPGTIKQTNVQRNDNDFPPLDHSTVLDDIAARRANDMFEKQYFAHISPSGAGAESTAKEAGYDYLALGENLAMGNFKDDADLLRAWMNSPGHRANILDPHYLEIGVAVKKGIFSAEGGSPPDGRAGASGGEGDSVWIAVQIFGKPASACPRIDQSLRMQIETDKAQINNLQALLAAKKQETENMQNRQEYYQKAEEYNALITQYNGLVNETKAMIANYNSEVSTYNQCIAQ